MPEDPSEKTKLGLGDILGSINEAGRLPEASLMPAAAPITPDEVVRGLAVSAGIEPEQLLEDLRHGGTAVTALRHLVGLAAPEKGRPRQDDLAWARFCVVVWEHRRVVSGKAPVASYRGIGRAVDAASEWWVRAFPEEHDTAHESLKRNYYACQKPPPKGRGWSAADVPPEGMSPLVAAILGFRDPPERGR